MGLFDLIFKKPNQVQASNFFKTLTGYAPVFKNWNGCLYENELVRNAVDTRARHISKLKVEVFGSREIHDALKHRPNNWQTWGQFLYRLSTILDMQNTAFIVPIFDKYGVINGLYPILPTDYELVQDSKGTPYIRFQFATGNWASMELSKIGIMTKFQYRSDYFGESNNALTPTMELINIQNQGIKEGVKSSATYRFMAKFSNFKTDEDLAKERQAFTRDNLQSGGGLLLFPNTFTDIKQIDSKPYVVDAGQMELIQNNVFNYFGVNEDVLQNKAYGDKWSAFYEGAVEPFAIQFSEVVTNMLFSRREQSFGSIVMATANRLQYMTTQEKLNVSAQLSDRGILNRDEIRDIWNLPPLPNGEGQAYIIRGEYYNADEKINESEVLENANV